MSLKKKPNRNIHKNKKIVISVIKRFCITRINIRIDIYEYYNFKKHEYAKQTLSATT